MFINSSGNNVNASSSESKEKNLQNLCEYQKKLCNRNLCSSTSLSTWHSASCRPISQTKTTTNLLQIIIFAKGEKKSCPSHRTLKRIKFHVMLFISGRTTDKKKGEARNFLRSQECKPRNNWALFCLLESSTAHFFLKRVFRALHIHAINSYSH